MSKTWMPARLTVLGNARIKFFSFAAKPFFLTSYAAADCGGEQSAPCVLRTTAGCKHEKLNSSCISSLNSSIALQGSGLDFLL